MKPHTDLRHDGTVPDGTQSVEQLRRFRAAMDISGDAIYLVDRATMRFVDVNQTACTRTGYTREELLRMGPQDLLKTGSEDLERSYDEVIAAGEQGITTESTARYKDGRKSQSELHRRALRTGDGWIIVSIARDITRRKRAEMALRESEEKYRIILESIEEAYFEVDLKGNLVFLNAAFCRLLGYSEHELMGMNNRRYQSPEVAARVFETFNEVYRTGAPKIGNDWEMIRKDGSKVLVEASVNLIRDGHRKPTGFRGMLRDVTARRQVEQALRESEERFRSLTELSSDWYWEQDADFRFSRFEGQRVSGANDTWKKTLLGKRPWENGYDVDGEGGWEAHRALLHAHQPFRDFIQVGNMPDGTRRFTSVSGEPMFDAEGRFAGYRGIGTDITERKQAEQRIEYLATHDELTGLPNRVMFGQLLRLAIESARRHQRKLAVLFIDLDRFKTVNDTLGHEAGDALLKRISAGLKDRLRASDVVARQGGDEFVVLVQEVTGTGAVAAVARKILSRVIESASSGGQDCGVTASVGISMYPADAQDGESLMKSADTAMYFAKEQGKNNFQFVSGSIETPGEALRAMAR